MQLCRVVLAGASAALASAPARPRGSTCPIEMPG